MAAESRKRIKTCTRCGGSLDGATVEKAPGHSHHSKTAMVRRVHFDRRIYTCPTCGTRNTRDTRVTWGGDEGKH